MPQPMDNDSITTKTDETRNEGGRAVARLEVMREELEIRACHREHCETGTGALIQDLLGRKLEF